MSHFKVSIIIPVYNVEKYLNKCLDSVLSQTLKDIEIICINDGSTDNSLKILEEYSKKDKRLKVISKKNEGQGIARNCGINEAKGDYIAFVDSDDFISEDMFEKLYDKALKYNLDINMCKVSSYDDITHEINNDLWYYSLECFSNFKKDIFNHLDTKEFTSLISVTPYNKIYKRSFIEKYKIRFPENLIFEDEVFFYNVYLLAKRISLINENLYFYRVNRKGSTVFSSDYSDYTDVITVFKLVRNVLIKTNNLKTYKKQVYNRFIHLILWRFSHSSKLYKETFFNLMKEDFKNIFSNEVSNDFKINSDDLELKIKSRFLKVLKAKNLYEFEDLDSEKIFTIIMAFYNNEEYLKEAIDSLIIQNFGFEHNVQLILVDDGSTDSSYKIAHNYKERFPDNIILLSKENGGQASARNLALMYTKGDFVNFLDGDDKLSPVSLASVYKFFLEHQNVDIASIPITFFDNQKGPHILNYKYKKEQSVDLLKNPEYPQLSISSAFIKKEALKGFNFNEFLVNSEDALLLNKILIKNPKLGIVKRANYLYRKRFDQSSTIDNSQLKKEFFTYRLKYYFKQLINDSLKEFNFVPEFIQYTLAYDIQWIIKVSDINNFFNKNEKFDFFNILKDVLSYIDSRIIKKHQSIDEDSKYFMLALKSENQNIKIDNYGNISFTGNHNTISNELKRHKLYVDIIEIRNGFLNISGFLSCVFKNENIKIKAIKEDENGRKEEFKGNYFNYPSRKPIKFLSINWKFYYNFDLKIPLNKNDKSKVSLYVNYIDSKNSFSLNLPILFDFHAGLSKISNYFVKDSQIVLFKNNLFNIIPYSYRNHVKFEFKCLKKIYNYKDHYYSTALAFRLTYIFLYPFIKNKRIWLFMDRRNEADDNAEHLFKYAVKQNDDVKKFFTVSEDSKDFSRLKGYKNLIPFYSIKQRLIYIFAEKIISSHPDENIVNPFNSKNRTLYSGLFTSKKYFLQHGVTKDNISIWLRKYDKNLSLILTVSDLEHDSFLDEDYNYDKEIIQTLGFPRFDNLKKEKTKKQILIMPSWRENLIKNKKTLINSEYFIKLNSLINNIEIINDSNKDDNYEIIFKPHPHLLKFINLFDISENVIIDKNSTYQELFNKSALLITDYSSVAFDFSYLKKPVIYYQYSDDYNFDLDKSYFDYEEMGFGEVIREEEDLINLINDYLKNDCKMKDKFIKRVDKFYKFKDRNNCKRVYEWIYDN